ncbi:ribonuclease P protein component [Neisseria sp. Ec49-e6-T10]|uniref:ribonuclease P protein component n=1 Tax=Neisseria sp. Ec49-e6-T10 TaxID=3140744 RepID=UPI003EB8DB32
MNNGFDRRYRLLKADEFSSVFAFRRSKNNAYFQVFWGKNNLDYPRLGLIVAKKVAKKAHERNYMKRTIREWFRCHKHELVHADYIVRSKQKFEAAHHNEAILALSSLLKR